MAWVDAAAEEEVRGRGRLVVRLGDRQVLLLATERGLFATANRCPHEGYPLSEGTVKDCVLTCNWHNWKFDLASGETLVGGDRLRQYLLRLEAGRVWLDLTEPPVAERRAAILDALLRALGERDQQRLLRETARLERLGADPLDAIRVAVAWAHDRLEYGMTHAFAAAPDWLRIWASAGLGPDARLAALGEILGHVADDAEPHATFPFGAGVEPWDAAHFLAAIEAEDEDTAVRRLRGALGRATRPDDLDITLIKAGLLHYADFGHSLIYAVQALRLVARLGTAETEPILAALVRSLVFSQREDLLPEFRDYRHRLEEWGRFADAAPFERAALDRRSAKQAMAIVAGWAGTHRPEAIFELLVNVAAAQLLHADTTFLDSTDQKLSENVGWLDFTHSLTFAAAGLEAARRDPTLWPAVLLQLACFVGRNSPYGDPTLAVDLWLVADAKAFLDAAVRSLVNHGHGRFILSAHLPKTLFAVSELAEALPGTASTLWAALNRFLSAPLRARHPLRMARQMIEFVAQE
jgi:nitrite reductase/ring-hydroxylating ferredoxin subunit